MSSLQVSPRDRSDGRQLIVNADKKMHNQELKEAEKKADGIVIKRLRFVFKLLKAITAQPPRNRQSHAYIWEVLDAIGDWSGSYNPELVGLLDEQVFPQVCSLISTFSKDEFNNFQTIIAKYLLGKWKETSNFVVLDFIGDMYAFITRIAPFPVVEEYVEIFSLDSMPFHVTLIILPAILRNIPEEASQKIKNDLLSSPVMCLLRVPKEEITGQQRQIISQFWRSLSESIKCLRNFDKMIPIFTQCLVTSSYLNSFSNSDLVVILEDLLDWGNVAESFQMDAFLIISIIFLSSCWKNVMDSSTPFPSVLKNLFLLVGQSAKNSTNPHISSFVMRVVQKILEHSEKSWEEVIEEFAMIYEFSDCEKIKSSTGDARRTSSPQHETEILDSFEKCVKRIASESSIHEDEGSRKRLKLLVDELLDSLNEEYYGDEDEDNDDSMYE